MGHTCFTGLAGALLTLGVLTATVSPVTAAPLVPMPAGPIPPGPADAAVPAYVGAPVADRPVKHPKIPRHPFMAPTGRNSMHNDAYASDAYRGGGPRERTCR